MNFRFIKENAPSGTAPEARLRFTGLSALAGGGSYLSGGNQLGALALTDCQLSGGTLAVNVTGSTGRILTLTNNLWDQATLIIGNGSDPLTLYAYHNTFNLGSISFLPIAGNSWVIRDNYFHQPQLVQNANLTGANHNYNGYYTGYTRLTPNGANDRIVYVAPFESGPLGSFYINSGAYAQLGDTGSRNATAAGLYHHTVRVTQAKETNSTADLGYHSMALDSSGRPVDTDGDGWPDYLEDRNGNGSCDTGAGETDWTVSNNGLSGTGSLQVWTPLK